MSRRRGAVSIGLQRYLEAHDAITAALQAAGKLYCLSVALALLSHVDDAGVCCPGNARIGRVAFGVVDGEDLNPRAQSIETRRALDARERKVWRHVGELLDLGIYGIPAGCRGGGRQITNKYACLVGPISWVTRSAGELRRAIADLVGRTTRRVVGSIARFAVHRPAPTPDDSLPFLPDEPPPRAPPAPKPPPLCPSCGHLMIVVDEHGSTRCYRCSRS